ncbi:MAG: DUF1294 domain-containing protein [Chloroflexi bacterium]|nr:DUF1294 domain-containing protein [Chloroflexota bacterium]
MEISTQQITLFIVAILVAINLGSMIAIWLDKHRAKKGQWRIKEETLLVWALIGGWPGGIWAMRRFRHKTSKGSFIAKYVLAVVLNIGAVAVIVFVTIA